MKAKLAILGVDGVRHQDGRSYLAKGLLFSDVVAGHVPVWLEAGEHDFAHLVGTAKLSMHNDVVWADCELLSNRVLGTVVKVMYPHPCIREMKRDGKIIQEFYIDGVNLSAEAPNDKRIATMANQGVVAERKG
jgi:hypothetical protein